MKKPAVWFGMLLIALVVLTSGVICQAGDISQAGVDESAGQMELKQQCLSATVTAINLEIGRYQRWIDFRKQQGDQKGMADLQESLAALKADLDKYRAMNAKDYVLPEKIETVAWLGDKGGPDSALYVDGMSKSGPWYHLAGIAGGDYSAIQPKARYHALIYPVYSRCYWNMNSAYVYVASFEKDVAGLTKAGIVKDNLGCLLPDKKLSGDVFRYKYNSPVYDKVKCENYQVYLLKDLDFGSKSELILDSKQSAFNITLVGEKIAEYAYLEFVSPYGSKTFKIGEIKDSPFEVILEPEVYLKKPAIYLYPAAKTQVVLTHHFKGRILNTYPEYKDNWTVIAEPDGTLTNMKDNRSYKYLFWDGSFIFSKRHYQFDSGFYVNNKDYVRFLQDKLASIGLNEDEINDFVVYWLPALNKYNNCFIYFRINDNIDGSSILETSPVADTTIRVFMEFSGIEDLTGVRKLPEQKLPAFTRQGFTLVEWGGAEIGSDKIE